MSLLHNLLTVVKMLSFTVRRYEMMCKCWEMEPSGRPTFAELRSHFEGLIDGQHASDYVDFTASMAADGTCSLLNIRNEITILICTNLSRCIFIFQFRN